jgi:hypothetical protein
VETKADGRKKEDETGGKREGFWFGGGGEGGKVVWRRWDGNSRIW